MGKFQPTMTVQEALERIHGNHYVLPAIQREFVWSGRQICLLFDSLMRGYPIGSFLLWDVDADQAQAFRFYSFLTTYHEKDHPYAPVMTIASGKAVTAVLDGQQRLTALNIGVYGSLAERLPHKWMSNPDAYPVKRLYLDLLHDSDDESGAKYRFEFLTDAEAKPTVGEPRGWFKVGDILSFPDSGPQMLDWLNENELNLPGDTSPYHRLYSLYQAIREREALNAYLEVDPDPNTVLDIFVRVNSGGTQLSYSDLLLSMATNQWKELDAREEVRSLVAELNGGSREFNFTKDNVLKAGLVLTEVPDIKFKISNFTQANMAKVEKQWPKIEGALRLAAQLLDNFGYTTRTLSAHSVIIPLAYYLYRRDLGDSYLTASAHAADRAAVRMWLTRSLIKRNIWGSSLDTLLARLREAIRTVPPGAGFPTAAVEAAMADLGKPITFTAAEIGELADLQYGSPRTFAVIALLYPGLDLSQQFHEDHIFPRSRFTRARLTKAGVDAADLDDYLNRANGLANLQLLGGLANIAKQASWPWEWMAGPAFPTEALRDQYAIQNDLDLLPDDISGFVTFYKARRARIEDRLRHALDVSADEA